LKRIYATFLLIIGHESQSAYGLKKRSDIDLHF